MGATTRLVCLANSYKRSGRCVAGKVIRQGKIGEWIRPVGSSPTGELTLDQITYGDGAGPLILDVIDLPLGEPAPSGHQAENRMVAAGPCWAKVGRLDLHHLPKLVDTPETLWINHSSTRLGRYDRVTAEELASITESLYLIHLPGLLLRVLNPSSDPCDPKRAVRAVFTYRDTEYNLKVTDPVAEREILARGIEEAGVGECYLTISLGEPWGPFNYKLVAALVVREDYT